MRFTNYYLEESSLIKDIRKIAEMKTDDMQKIGEYDMDVKTARAIIDAYDMMPSKKKKVMASMPLGRMTDVAWQTKGFKENINEGKRRSIGGSIWKSAMDNPFVVRGTKGNVSNELFGSFKTLKDAKAEIKKLKIKDAVITNNVSGKVVENINEEKTYYQMSNVGTVKYLINFHDGKKKEKDGSPFYDIRTFKNKKDLENFKKELVKKGYKEKRP